MPFGICGLEKALFRKVPPLNCPQTLPKISFFETSQNVSLRPSFQKLQVLNLSVNISIYQYWNLLQLFFRTVDFHSIFGRLILLKLNVLKLLREWCLPKTSFLEVKAMKFSIFSG